ncbi:hypothetical protein [Saccharopolyspora sp. CA-218241]|uniref:hypothetical protein n=1 Tax=Saccharopolyspora sp. CA-218241 TaxID=3240027 RepID=UPI003D996DA0
MSGEERRAGAPQGPPWSQDLLADLHAGALDRDTADALRVQVREDPDARQVLAALEAAEADLAGLRADLAHPPPLSIPDDVAARIDEALENEVRNWSRPAAEQGPPAEVVDFAAAQRRRRRGITAGAGLLGVAAAAVTVFSLVPTGDDTDRTAAPPPAADGPPPLALAGGQVSLTGAQFADVLGTEQYGALADPQRLLGCLQANGVSSGRPMGAREITLDGRPAQLLVLPTGQIGQFRLLAVGPDCGPDNPATLSDTTFGGG